VWVGNNRGTKYSDKNSHLPKYWEFNLDHFAKYDQPALINKILDETGKNKIVYIGHSQGTTQFFLGLCENEYLQEKI
jgi:pimeloyl-ACP methyl ester carboxylesterase